MSLESIPFHILELAQGLKPSIQLALLSAYIDVIPKDYGVGTISKLIRLQLLNECEADRGIKTLLPANIDVIPKDYEVSTISKLIRWPLLNEREAGRGIKTLDITTLNKEERRALAKALDTDVDNLQKRLNEQKNKIIEIGFGIDWGSSSIKFSTLLMIGDRIYKMDPIEGSWGGYEKEIVGVGEKRIKILRQEIVGGTFKRIRAILSKVKTEFPNLPIRTSITGFDNNLAVITPDGCFVILDEPSVSTTVTETQRKILSQYFTNEEIDNLETKACSLTKLIAILNNREIIERVLGVHFNSDAKYFEYLKQVQFTSLTGLLANYLLHQRTNVDDPSMIDDEITVGASPAPIPTGEIKGFADSSLSVDETQNMFSELLKNNLGQDHDPSTNLRFADSYLMTSKDSVETLLAGPDFSLDVALISLLLNVSFIDLEHAFILCGSVGKVVSGPAMTISEKRIAVGSAGGKEMSYFSQRMFGNIGVIWAHVLREAAPELSRKIFEGDYTHIDETKLDYIFLEATITEAIATSTQTPYIFIPTETGLLCRRDELGQPITYHYNDLDNIVHLEKTKRLNVNENQIVLEIIIAIVMGILFGIRNKLEIHRSRNNIPINSPAIFSDGLVSMMNAGTGKQKNRPRNQDSGWTMALKLFMPKDMLIYFLDLPSSTISAIIYYLKQLEVCDRAIYEFMLQLALSIELIGNTHDYTLLEGRLSMLLYEPQYQRVKKMRARTLDHKFPNQDDVDWENWLKCIKQLITSNKITKSEWGKITLRG